MPTKHFFPNATGCSQAFKADATRTVTGGVWPAGTEPALEEVLADPLIHLLMRRDGVSLGALRRIVADASAGLGQKPCPCQGHDQQASQAEKRQQNWGSR